MVALARLGDQSVVEALVTAVSNRDGEIRLSAVTALGSVSGNERVVDTLIVALRDVDWEVREYAAYSLREHKPPNPRALEPLITALKDEVPPVRAAVIWALEELGDLRALPALEWVRENDHTPYWDERTISDDERTVHIADNNDNG